MEHVLRRCMHKIERRGENYRQQILTQSLQMHYRFVIHFTSLRHNSKAKIPTKEFDVNAGKIRPVAFWTTPETRKTGTALKDRYDALFIRALASAVMVITISLLTPAKNYHLVRLIPRFPSFALIAHFTVGSERTLKELKDDFVQLCGLILFSSTWQLPMR